MKYLLLIYANEKDESAKTKAAMDKMFADYMAFSEEVRTKKVFVAGEALTPTNTATTVRVRNGKTVTTDGPFAETKEQLGGFYLLDVKNLDEALAYAAKIPNAKDGSIEVRPLMVFENM